MLTVTGAIYDSDPHAAPDSAFRPGRLAHLVAGNHGRRLDARRTPVRITAVSAARGAFEVQLLAFEDEGARWELELAQIARFQFPSGTHTVDGDELNALRDAVARDARRVVIACDPAARAGTLARISVARAQAARWLDARGGAPAIDLPSLIGARSGDRRATALVADFLAERGVAEIDRAFAQRWVSNPESGELVKGHAVVLAQLGLAPYDGPVVRDPDLFAGAWSAGRRAEHLVARLAIMGELWTRWRHLELLPLYRGAAVDGTALPERAPASLASATFSREVADAHFAGGPATRTAVLWRWTVGADRLLMSFVETGAMSERFREAEAVLIGDPGA